MIVARLESTKALSCIFEKLKSLNYIIAEEDDSKRGFVYNKKNSHSNLTSDIKTVKNACNFTTSIKIKYGSSSNSV